MRFPGYHPLHAVTPHIRREQSKEPASDTTLISFHLQAVGPMMPLVFQGNRVLQEPQSHTHQATSLPQRQF